MTDRVKALVVVLKRDTRTDDIEALKAAISQFTNVIAVENNITDVDDFANQQRIRHELGTQLWSILFPSHQKG